MATSKAVMELDEQLPPPLTAAEDELDWQENQRRTADDLNKVDRAFLSGWAGLTGMWIALAIMASGTFGAVQIMAFWAHH